MSHDEDPISQLKDLPLQTEQRGFKSAEMVACAACLRANPPTRTNCMYCLAVLPFAEAAAGLRRPTLRPLEEWEQGYNNVLVKRGGGDLPEQSRSDVASLLRLDSEDVKRIFSHDNALPLARPATLEEASLMEEQLRGLGIETVIVPDADLAVEKLPPKRIRALVLQEESIVGRETGVDTQLSVPWSEVCLIVVGRLHVTRVEVEENKFRSGEKELVNSRQLSADEAVVDVYSRQQDGGWRIAAARFDFSCLGHPRSLLAAENFVSLTKVLSERAPAAEYDDSYIRVRQSLTAVWPMVQQTAGRGWRRARPGKYNVEAVTTTDNETQFTRYSRLLHYLKLKGD